MERLEEVDEDEDGYVTWSEYISETYGINDPEDQELLGETDQAEEKRVGLVAVLVLSISLTLVKMCGSYYVFWFSQKSELPIVVMCGYYVFCFSQICLVPIVGCIDLYYFSNF